jgi:predicted aldo/keto reductase-like oxidoreductase
MMEYRKLPRGNEKLSVLGLGMGSIHKAPEDEIENIIRRAIEHGINYFDLCAGSKKVYKLFGNAIKGQREKVFFPLHFGAVYGETGEYGWSRNPDEILKTIEWELLALGTDYADFGFLHCVDEKDDYDVLRKNGVFDRMLILKEEGVIHHIGFSSHTLSVANMILDDGFADFFMFSINAAYDYECGDESRLGNASERYELFRRCEKDGIGIAVMKPFHGGQLLDKTVSPFKKALTHYQCLQYVLDRPGVLTTVPGIRSMEDLNQLLGFADALSEEKDYSVIASFTPEKVKGSCVYCNHCQPCPAGIDIGLANKYYDLAIAGDDMAKNHYTKLAVKADNCISCGHCDSRCPFGVLQSSKMKEIEMYFSQSLLSS